MYTTEAGTKLEVTPRISQGGYLSLEYAIELSSFDRTVAQAQGLQPPRQTENYDSTVTIPSDSTIVVGGFTLSQASESDSGIPLLKGREFAERTYSTVPWIGWPGCDGKRTSACAPLRTHADCDSGTSATTHRLPSSVIVSTII